ncbi:hypothetical protein F5Y11DRAFT_363253 [Daldinia sp. FL1419]|nr:hypothetical protein F5Y11DRAFT_363253 [Daldinia sp. FL1419]
MVQWHPRGTTIFPTSPPVRNEDGPQGFVAGLIKDERSMIDEMFSRHAQRITRYCQDLSRMYHETGDAIWLEKHRVTLQQSIAGLDASITHREQLKNTLQEKLRSLQTVSTTNDLPTLQNHEATAIKEEPVTPPRIIPAALQLFTPREVKEGEDETTWLSEFLKKKIKVYWHQGHSLHFALLYAGTPTFPVPQWYFAHKLQGEWVADWLKLPIEVIDIKRYNILGTCRNAYVILQAHDYLRIHKTKLIREFAKLENQPLENCRLDF